MKNKNRIMKNIFKIGTALLVVFALGACNKETMQQGRMTVKMTDAPGLYHQVNVEIMSVEVHYEDSTDSTSGWMSLATNAGVYDLLTLQDSVTAILADSVSLPEGRINQMRLILGSDNNVMLLDSSYADLGLSSQQKTGLKLNLNATIEPNMDTEVLIDFDASKSIVVKGNGSLQLKPVIKVVSVEQQ